MIDTMRVVVFVPCALSVALGILVTQDLNPKCRFVPSQCASSSDRVDGAALYGRRELRCPAETPNRLDLKRSKMSPAYTEIIYPMNEREDLQHLLYTSQ